MGKHLLREEISRMFWQHLFTSIDTIFFSKLLYSMNLAKYGFQCCLTGLTDILTNLVEWKVSFFGTICVCHSAHSNCFLHCPWVPKIMYIRKPPYLNPHTQVLLREGTIFMGILFQCLSHWIQCLHYCIKTNQQTNKKPKKRQQHKKP